MAEGQPGAVERWQRATSWLESGDGVARPDATDVEVVARLGVADVAVLKHLLLTDRASLAASWDELQEVLRGGTPDTRTAPANPRLTALRQWVDQARERGVDVTGVTEGVVERLATIAPTSLREFKQFDRAVRRHDKELLEVLTTAEADGVDAAADDEKAAASGPAPAASTAQPAGTPAAGAPPTTAQARPVPADEAVAPASPTPQRRPRPSGVVSTTGFAPFVYPDVAPTHEVHAIAFHATGDESVHMSWPSPPDDGRTRIFRVSTNPAYVPDASPDLGTIICATPDTEATDRRPFDTPVRHVAVWVNEGHDEASARSAQPLLHATGGVVLPVTNVSIYEDEGTVIGQWSAPEGTGRTYVLRLEATLAETHHHFDESLRVPQEAVASGGFIDRDAQPGMEYEYRVYSLASLAGGTEEMLSPPVAARIRLKAVLEAVNDLDVRPSTTTGVNTYDLSWTMPPLGQVEIYRSLEQPEPGIDKELIDRSVLERNGSVLNPQNRLGWRREESENRVVMREVPWPTGWSRAYFTPVTVVSEDRIKVGRTQILARANEVSHVRLVERVDEQFLTLAWPDGVSTVKVFVLPAGGQLVDPASQTAVEECTRDEYRRLGGIHLRHPLPSEGCSVHVVGTAYSRGVPVMSSPVAVEYPGLARIRYRIVTNGEKSVFGRTKSVASRIVVSCDIAPENLPLVLVHNPRRLPLHAGDGTELHRRSMSFAPGAEHAFLEQFNPGAVGGFVRLFADVGYDNEHRVAVLDPAVNTLRCP